MESPAGFSITLKHKMSNINIIMIFNYLLDIEISFSVSYINQQKGSIIMIADKIKTLRESNSLTQADIAKKLGITRSSVNAWEMGISVPSTMYIVELARLFGVSTDYILGLEQKAALDISGLDEESVRILTEMALYMRSRQE